MRLKIFAFFLVLAFLFVPFAMADETVGDYFYSMGTQVGRGLENIVTSFAEIPCTIRTDMKEEGSSGFFVGLGMGPVYMLRRMLVGVLEVGTFFLPRDRTIPRVCQETKPGVT